MNYEANLNQRAALFKALGHPARLLILNLVRMQPRHGEELAAILGLTPATVSHHLSKLAEVGLVTSEKEQYYQVYSPAGQMLEKTLEEMVRLPQPGVTGNVAEDAYREKVLRTFFKHGRLTQIPAQQKKRLVVLEHLVQEFEPGREYPEREVNHILLDFNEDVATLRREMIDHGLMTREKGVYRRLVE
jgi:biotin operon repressor